jgi:hypothetical protein
MMLSLIIFAAGVFAFMVFMEANVYRFKKKTYGKIKAIQGDMIFIADAYGHTYKRTVNDIYPAY